MNIMNENYDETTNNGNSSPFFHSSQVSSLPTIFSPQRTHELKGEDDDKIREARKEWREGSEADHDW